MKIKISTFGKNIKLKIFHTQLSVIISLPNTFKYYIKLGTLTIKKRPSSKLILEVVLIKTLRRMDLIMLLIGKRS